MARLENKVCLITGAAKGQGAAEARLFASEGARVWLTDVLDEEGEAVAAEVTGTFRHLDVVDETNWEALVDEMITVEGRVDVLINNAGIFRSNRLVDTPIEEFELVMQVNCTGVFLGMRSVGRAMKNAETGVIVNISSLAGMASAPGAFAYGASKWAVRGMTKTAAVELARYGIRVNSIHPGAIDTEMLSQIPNGPERLIRGTPMRRAASAEEVANMALFLASDESSYSTGSEFLIDGGIHAV
ncbi:MAG: SDR family oxidoreductase [Gammaproteobacteria bacterium]|nr:SDR family oxidoreductase [Gammaproteobacteria bacterium]MCZ6853678.1 SDR family oxidoreductase [Gammaproteobacteria bacterium]